MMYLGIIGCLVIVMGIFLGDSIIKMKIEQSTTLPRKILGGRAKLQKFHNPGMALGFGKGKQKVVALCSVLLVLLATAIFVMTLGTKGNVLLKVGLSLLLGGAFSNTYDRLKRKYVVDYLSFEVKWKRFARIVFNISDFCIMGGALLICLSEILRTS